MGGELTYAEGATGWCGRGMESGHGSLEARRSKYGSKDEEVLTKARSNMHVFFGCHHGAITKAAAARQTPPADQEEGRRGAVLKIAQLPELIYPLLTR